MNIEIKFKAAVLAAIAMMGSVVAHAIVIDVVAVGNAGNAADTNGYGAVAYSYAMATHEVTNTHYAAFLNAVAATDTYSLYNTVMGSSSLGGITRSGSSGSYSYTVKGGFEDKPVNYVSFWDAARFANWLNNGQGGASTETGSYTLGGVTNPVNGSVTRNGGANWVVPTENEWYKAAYYDPTLNSGTGGYWLHATQSNALGQNNPFTATNGANYDDGDFANGGFAGPGVTDVGAYSDAPSFYGTYDQGGNLGEWNQTVSGTGRGLRGGSWDESESFLRSSQRGFLTPANQEFFIGFRVASLAPIPEPSTYGAVLGGMALAALMARRWKARIARKAK